MATETVSAEPDIDIELATQPQTSEQVLSDSDRESKEDNHATDLTEGKVKCICGATMLSGAIQQEQSPKCANANCPSPNGAAVSADTHTCYYCPLGTSPNQHKTGFYYCHTCAAAVAQSGFTTQTQPIPIRDSDEQPFQRSTSKVSALTQIRLITWKNYKTQIVRRKCSFCCKMCCPLLFILIMGIVGLLRPFFTFYVNCAEGQGSQTCADMYTAPERHNQWNQWSYAPSDSNSFFPRFLCVEDWDEDEICSGEEYCDEYGCYRDCYRPSRANPPHLIGIVYDSAVMGSDATLTHVNNVMALMSDNYLNASVSNLDFDGWIMNDTFGFICREFAADHTLVNWTEGSMLKHFESESALDEYVRSEMYGEGGYNFENTAVNGALRPLVAAIVFKSVSSNGKIWDYSLRFNSTEWSGVPQTFENNEFMIVDRVTKDSNSLMEQSLYRYQWSGFIEFQMMIDTAIMQYINDEERDSLNRTYMDFMKGWFVFPFDSYQTDIYWTFMRTPFTIFATIMFIWPVIQILSVLVSEKASQIKEGMKMMGATASIYWASMYLWFALEFTLICVIVVAIGFLMDVFLYSDALIMIAWFWLFCLSQMCWSTLLSVFFDNPKTATIVGFVLYFVLIGMGVAMGQLSAAQKQLFCLLATPCFMESINVVVQYESALTGVQWNNLNEHVSQFSMATCLTMLFIDCIIYSLLTLYLDNTWPTRFGQKKSVIFCLYPSFWCKKSTAPKPINASYDMIPPHLRKLAVTEMKNYEDVSGGNLGNKDPVILVRNLSKSFGSDLFGKKHQVLAVKGISLDIYPGEVFCLLGHNGAGKTTTLSMLAGLLSSTHGEAYINGNNIAHGMNEIRKFLGVCPQHDILWDLMTAEDHLRFFARLKGVPSDQINYEINTVINTFNMLDSGLWGKYPPNMSGGERRRLSLAISLIGGSSIVFLDEPTSGMDPENRRKVWDIIEKEKKNRCIILTTHYMDEADILGDRIAIMSNGQIKCCGSSLYLKRLYGVGYSFTVSLKSGVNLTANEEDKPLKTEIDSVLEDINGVETVSVAASEILYKLPFEASPLFANVFQKLDDKHTQLKIETFGVSVTTLEEVFLKIGHDDSHQSLPDSDEAKYENDRTDNIEDIQFEQAEFALDDRNPISIFIIHVYAILYKRFWWSIRDIKGIICQVILPAALVGLLFGLTDSIQISQRELHIHPSSQFVGEYTETVVVPMSQLDSDTSVNVSNLYYTDMDNNWPLSWKENMQTHGFGHNISYSIGVDAATDMSCVGRDYGSFQSLNDGYFYSNAEPNCTAAFQESVYHYSSDDNTPYFGFWFTPIENEVLFGLNSSAYHSLPMAVNVWNNWVLRNVYSSDETAMINVYSHPFPITKQQQQEESIGNGIGMTINLIIAFTLIPASSIYFITNEKSIGTKHQQFVSGISILSYWIGTYISDILLGVPASAATVMLVYIFDVEEFKDEATMPLFLSLILFVAASISMGYLLHFLFKSPGKAQFITILFNILLGVVFTIVTSVLDGIGSESTDGTSEDMKSVVRILPIFLLSENILRILSKKLENPTKSYWSYKVTQRNINYMIFESLGYFTLVILIEYLRSFPSLLAKLGFVVDQPRKYIRLDSDVQNEQERIKQCISSDGSFIENKLDDTVILAGLRKVFKGENKFSPYKPAVRDMFFGVKLGEVFGFLGTNGAGKTTTLSLLTGQNYPSQGIGYINGKSIVNEQLAIRRNIGFCPQNDAIFDLLTAYEHLKFYALIKGLNGNQLNKQIKVLLTALTLNKYSNRTSMTYSGGNKRKLCVAQSMIGNPPVIFLDEPSTGMDPVSRRFMWKFINQTMKGRAVILTTHSMEECEALCHRVGIMVSGQLSCIGSPQYLKSKFGKGYQLDITLQQTMDDTSNIIHDLLEEFNKTFPTTILQQNGNKLLLEIRQYDINSDGDESSTKLAALGKMFDFVETVKQKYAILSYALSQTSLEQVFLKMAQEKGQVEQEQDTTMEQRELLKIIKQENKQDLVKRIAILNRDHLEQILENEIKNGSQYIVKALMNSDESKQDQ